MNKPVGHWREETKRGEVEELKRRYLSAPLECWDVYGMRGPFTGLRLRLCLSRLQDLIGSWHPGTITVHKTCIIPFGK